MQKNAKNSEKREKKGKNRLEFRFALFSFEPKNYSSEAKRKIWSEKKRKEAKKEKWNFIVK